MKAEFMLHLQWQLTFNNILQHKAQAETERKHFLQDKMCFFGHSSESCGYGQQVDRSSKVHMYRFEESSNSASTPGKKESHKTHHPLNNETEHTQKQNKTK